jgi:aminoglycoside phosphotransferase
VDRLPHGYTNFTRRLAGGLVEKTYDGPRRWDNARRELACLTSLAGRLPVPSVVQHDVGVPRLTITELPGTHGQDLLDAGHHTAVLKLVGSALAELQRIEIGSVPGIDGSGAVIVHGDFGPQNMLLDLSSNTVTGIVDWESAHVGDPIEDLAWAEWVVRAHHPDAVNALDALFTGAGQQPPWSARHAAMLRQVRAVLAYCESAGMDRSADDWRDRLRTTERWANE